jgi:nicotinic acid mononucleotide adenylyltransferase
MPDISSTDVRTFLSSGESDKAKTLLDQEVFDYIVANNLY